MAEFLFKISLEVFYISFISCLLKYTNDSLLIPSYYVRGHSIGECCNTVFI